MNDNNNTDEPKSLREISQRDKDATPQSVRKLINHMNREYVEKCREIEKLQGSIAILARCLGILDRQSDDLSNLIGIYLFSFLLCM